MQIALMGNCQIGPLRKIMEMMLPEVEFPSLPAVHTIREENSDFVLSKMESADLIFSQYVSDEYPLEMARSSRMRASYPKKVVIWPNLYFKGYSPDIDVLHDQAYANFHGPLYDYHSEKILFGFLSGKSAAETSALMEGPTELDEYLYKNAAEDGFSELGKRELITDVAISDRISDWFPEQRLFYIMNHPCNRLLIELAVRLFDVAGIRGYRKPHDGMVSDSELNAAIPFENDYMRHHWNWRFPRSGYARGTTMVAANNILGVTSGHPRLYTVPELTEAFYRFYEPHEARLRTTRRVTSILRRTVAFG